MSPTFTSFSHFVVAALLTSRAVADSCPGIWSTVASDLSSSFSGCNRNARDAIRFAFHDASGYSSKNTPYEPASGGADGSLLLSSTEITRSIENPLQGYQQFLLGKYNQYKDQDVGAADLVQFAGNVGLKACPGAPTVKTLVGRKDTSTAAPEGTLPQGFGPGSDSETITQLFLDKGFSEQDLAALIGAHTVSQAFAQQGQGIPPGASQDTTPTKWDNTYYQELSQNNEENEQQGHGRYNQMHGQSRGVYHFQSDINLSQSNTTVGSTMAQYANDQDAFNAAFADAMARMNLLGVPAAVVSRLTDCTSVISAL